MKTLSSYFLVPFQPWHQPIARMVTPTLAPSLVAAAMVASFLLAEGGIQKAAAAVVGSAWTLGEDVRLRLGTVALAPDPKPAKFSFDKAKGQIGYAGEWAGTAAGNMLSTTTSEPILDLVVGVGTLLATPVAAVKGASDARKHLSPDKLSECETNLGNAMSEMAVQQRFHDWLFKAANEKCPGRLVPLEQRPNASPSLASADAVLEARVEELRLERTGSSDTSFRLRITTRTRLVRAADRAVLCDQPDEYQSGKCLFADWTLHNAFQSVAETGYRQLAEQCVNRLLTTTDKLVFVGAGYRKAPASNKAAPVTLASRQTPFPSSAARLVSYPTADTGTLGIYSTGNVTHVILQRPLTRDQATSEALDDVNHTFSGMVEHPCILVELTAAAVATPISLCKQGGAVARGLSPHALREADAKLTAAAEETRPHQELAVQVAQQLAPQTSQPVMLVRQPSLPGAQADTELMGYIAHGTLASLTGGQTPGGYLLSQGADTALEIHVESARLAGKEGINPKLALCVEARATLLRSRDGQQLYSCPVQYRSKGHTFTQWAAHDARLFRGELQKGYRDLSASMVNQLVSHGVVPPDRKPQPTFAAN